MRSFAYNANVSSCCLQGYLFISVLVSANSELIKLIIQSIKNDLSSRNPINVCLALQCIANIGNEEMVEAVGKEVPKLLVSPDTNDSVKQCAALCVLKLFRLKHDILPPGEWTSRIVQLLNDKHLVSCFFIILGYLRVGHLILRALAIRASNPQNALARISFHSPKSLPPPPPRHSNHFSHLLF